MFIDDLEHIYQSEKSWADEVFKDFDNVMNKNQEYLDFIQPWIDEIEKYFETVKVERIK